MLFRSRGPLPPRLSRDRPFAPNRPGRWVGAGGGAGSIALQAPSSRPTANGNTAASRWRRAKSRCAFCMIDSVAKWPRSGRKSGAEYRRAAGCSQTANASEPSAHGCISGASACDQQATVGKIRHRLGAGKLDRLPHRCQEFSPVLWRIAPRAAAKRTKYVTLRRRLYEKSTFGHQIGRAHV